MSQSNEPQTHQPLDHDGQQAPQDPERREALVRSGKYAAYTAPVMLTMLLPEKSKAQIGPPPSPPAP